jgi:hemoglobin/transferrin/lactoferrin receptor protein
LPTLVVTPTGLAIEAFDAPYIVEVLDAAELQVRRLARTLPEGLKELPAVMIQKTAHGQGSPYIRGFTGFRTLMLIDGVRLNNSTFRDGPNQYWATIDPFSIGRLELVKGPASVLYGSDAIGGTVNVLPAQRGRLDESGALGGRAIWRYASAEHAQVGRAEVSGHRGRQLAGFAGVSVKRFGDLRAGSPTGLQPKTGYDERAGDLTLEYFPAPTARLVAAYQGFRQEDAWRTHRTIYGRTWRGTAVGNDNKLALDQSRDLAYVQYRQQQIGGPVDSLQLTLSHHWQGEFEERVRSTNQVNQQGVDVGTLGFSAQLESPSAVGRWTYGAELYRDRVDSFRRNYRANGTLDSIGIQGPVADEARYDQAGVYVQDSVALGNRCDVVLGARHTRADVTAGRVQDPVTGREYSLAKAWHATVGSGRVLWKIEGDTRWRLFGGISQGFRAPNLSDLTRFDIARSGELEVPSPNLTPERFTSFEAGLKVQHRRASAELAFFHTRISSMIDRLAADNPATVGVIDVVKANVGRGRVRGLELAGHFELHPQLSLWGNLTKMMGESDALVTSAPAVVSRRPMTRIMPPTASTGLRWDSAARKVWLETDVTVAARQDRLSPGDVADNQRVPPGGTPGYSVVNLRAGWRVSPHVIIAGVLENVTDKDYRIHGSGLNEPGRNLVLTTELKF